MMVRCLDGMAEIALAADDPRHGLVYADELLANAEPKGLRELEEVARHWRGEAMLASKDYRGAQTELSRARARAIAEAIEKSMASSDFKARLRLS